MTHPTYADRDIQPARRLAAALVLLSGMIHLALLWVRPLSEETVITACCGAVYLFLSLGLLGVSRTSLLLAVALPLARTGTALYHRAPQDFAAPGVLLMVIDGVVVLLVLAVLRRVWRLPPI